MRRFRPLVFIALVLLLQYCKPAVQLTAPPADAPAALVALTGASVLIGAGDIARCDAQGDELTAKLVDSVLRADSAAKVHDEVMALGDNAYPSGSAQDYAKCFAPSWGDTAKLIMKNIRPTPGNHEHLSNMAAPYYEYFGKAAGSPKKGFYSYDIGEWHAIVLNSEIVVNTSFTNEERKEQEDWLKKEVEGNTKKCTLAYWHHPRYSSGWHGTEQRLMPIWQILYDANVDLVLNGHDHNYERYLPQDPLGVLDSTRGIVQIVAGTGGGDLRGFGSSTPGKNSAYQIQGHYGVLKLTLGKEEWQSVFIDTNGRTWDAQGGKCH
ncbi:MAG TPA: metallophosphoesterase [Gemmatimonadales bacterium]|nr:metallophosphoesterase [Gemmatimonadales bacterium]